MKSIRFFAIFAFLPALFAAPASAADEQYFFCFVHFTIMADNVPGGIDYRAYTPDVFLGDVSAESSYIRGYRDYVEYVNSTATTLDGIPIVSTLTPSAYGGDNCLYWRGNSKSATEKRRLQHFRDFQRQDVLAHVQFVGPWKPSRVVGNPPPVGGNPPPGDGNPPPQTAGVIAFTLIDQCTDPGALHARFFGYVGTSTAGRHDYVWPSSSNVYTTNNRRTVGDSIQVTLGESGKGIGIICFGAKLDNDGDTEHWGVGLVGGAGCSDCCYRVPQSGTHEEIIDLTCQ